MCHKMTLQQPPEAIAGKGIYYMQTGRLAKSDWEVHRALIPPNNWISRDSSFRRHIGGVTRDSISTLFFLKITYFSFTFDKTDRGYKTAGTETAGRSGQVGSGEELFMMGLTPNKGLASKLPSERLIGGLRPLFTAQREVWQVWEKGMEFSYLDTSSLLVTCWMPHASCTSTRWKQG